MGRAQAWLQLFFARKKCSQIVAIGEYFGRFGYLCNYSEEVEDYKTKVS